MRSTPSLPATQNSALASVGWGRGRTGGVGSLGSSGAAEVEGFTGVREHARVLDEVVIDRDDLHLVLERHRSIICFAQ